MEFVSYGHDWLTPAAKKKKSSSDFVDFFDFFDLFAEGVKHMPAGRCFRF
jgi:hypothetical protein